MLVWQALPARPSLQPLKCSLIGLTDFISDQTRGSPLATACALLLKHLAKHNSNEGEQADWTENSKVEGTPLWGDEIPRFLFGLFLPLHCLLALI